MRRSIAIAGAAALLVGAASGVAVAGEPNGCGNGQAVWKMDVPEHTAESGAEWGQIVSAWASGEEHKGGVSEGVHFAKTACKS